MKRTNYTPSPLPSGTTHLTAARKMDEGLLEGLLIVGRKKQKGGVTWEEKAGRRPKIRVRKEKEKKIVTEADGGCSVHTSRLSSLSPPP